MGSQPFSRLRLLLGEDEFRSLPDGVGLATRPTNSLDEETRCSLQSSDARSEISRPAGVPTCHALSTQPESLSALYANTEASLSFTRGDRGMPGVYCPILALASYPYKCLNARSDLAHRVSQKCFAQNKFWDNPWTLYYIHMPPQISAKPLVFVPEREFCRFLDKVEDSVEEALPMPTSPGFRVHFTANGAPLPRYLGLSQSKVEFERLKKDVPARLDIDFAMSPDGTVVPPCAADVFKTWEEAIDFAYAATTRNGKTPKQMQEEQARRDASLQQEIRGLKRLFGLVEEHQHVHDLTRTVFIAVDVEVYERNHGLITEIGVAILYGSDVYDLASGPGGHNWMGTVQGKHLWIKENSRLLNREFVTGCPTRYETKFGTTEIVSLESAVEILDTAFRDPTTFMRPRMKQLDQALPTRVVLVGHGIESDIRYLQTVGYDLTNAPNVTATLDSARLSMAITKKSQPVGLSALLSGLQIQAWNLHNAGNDAAYTLQALIGIAVQAPV